MVKVSSDSTALDAFSKIQNATVTGVAIIDEEVPLAASVDRLQGGLALAFTYPDLAAGSAHRGLDSCGS